MEKSFSIKMEMENLDFGLMFQLPCLGLILPIMQPSYLKITINNLIFFLVVCHINKPPPFKGEEDLIITFRSQM